MSALEPREWERILAEQPERASLKAIYNRIAPDFTVKRPADLPPPRPFEAIQAEKVARNSFLRNEYTRRMIRKNFFEHPIWGEGLLFDPAHERWLYLHLKRDMFARPTIKSTVAVTLFFAPIPIVSYFGYRYAAHKRLRYERGVKEDATVYRFHDMYIGC